MHPPGRDELKRSNENLQASYNKIKQQQQKIEADLEATRFAGGLNNSLKVNQDPGMVLEIMLSRRKGYLPMLESLEEALEDIEAHLLAMGEGARVSLENTLKVFSPDEIEFLLLLES